MYGDAITTKARVKGRLQITSTSFDDLFDNLILSVTARIEQMCGRRFIQGTYTNELHDGSDIYGARRKMLIAKNAPVQAVSSVEYKTGLNTNPTWRSYTANDYDVDLFSGILHIKGYLPSGKQNIRITYTGGFSGYSIGVNNFWFFNVTPTGTVNGTNDTFTLSETATQVIVYADGIRLASANVSFTAGESEFQILNNFQPFSTISVDYLRENAAGDSDFYLPADLVEVCEEAVVRLFKRRDSEGRAQESFQESSITWNASIFTKENLATIKNYRRGYNFV